MNILLLGSGGREHALAWKLKQSPLLTNLFIAPGNPGTARCGTNLSLGVNDFQAIRNAVLEHDIHMVIPGPEDPLVAGLHDFFLADPELKNIPVIGPVKMAAQLEGSKKFAKEFMLRHGIPTAGYQSFGRAEIDPAIAFLKQHDPPYVIKADGLAAGKGVSICPTFGEAVAEIHGMLLDRRFGDASSQVVIEQFLDGTELSVFILTDGIHYLLLPEAKDYKRVGEGDTGPNTGGMGSVSPVPFADAEFMDKVDSRIIVPTLNGLRTEGIPYTGFIFFGLMSVAGEPYVIEYNCRLGDPETESVLPRIVNDLVPLFSAVANRTLGQEEIVISPAAAATVMLVSEGYPGPYTKGIPVAIPSDPGNCHFFHAGTAYEPSDRNTIVTSGGRVLAVTAAGTTQAEALHTAYSGAGEVHFSGKNFRTDIGRDLGLLPGSDIVNVTNK